MTKKKRVFYSPGNYIAFLVIVLVIFVFSALYLKKQNTPAPEGTNLISQDTQAKSLVELVDEAAAYLQKNGQEKAFAEFRKEGKWRGGETYLFVYDTSGTALLLPPQSNLEGTNRLSARDSKGRYFVREIIEYLQTHTSGWLSYYYIKPGNETQYQKLSYFKKVSVSGKQLIIGSGVYLE